MPPSRFLSSYLILFSLTLQAQDLVVPVLNERIPNFRESTSATGRVIDLNQFFGAEPILDEMVRLRATYENDDNELVNTDLDFLLFKERTPLTLANFLGYVERGDYLNSFVHRSAPRFVIQGGGFALLPNENNPLTITPVATQENLLNEFGVSNTLGTISMAKMGGNPDSATSQWFVSLGENSDNLDTQNGGFTVFGRISQSTFPNATLLDPSFPNSIFQLEDFGGALSDTPLHRSAFEEPPQPQNREDFFVFSSTTLQPVPSSEAGTDETLSFAASVAGSAPFSATLTEGLLDIQYLTPTTGSLVTFFVSATDSVGNEVRDTFTITFDEGAEDYESWRLEQFSPDDAADDSVSSPLADPNNDGRSNLQAFIQGFGPFAPISTDIAAIQSNPNNNEVRLSFPYRSDTGGTRIQLESSEDLITWKLTPFTDITTTAQSASSLREILIDVNEQTRPQMHYRLVFRLD